MDPNLQDSIDKVFTKIGQKFGQKLVKSDEKLEKIAQK